LTLVAVLDANVLYPASLRDFLLRLAGLRIYTPKWTDQIHEEWTRNLLAQRTDLPPAQISRTRRLMDVAFPNALVTDYEPLIPQLNNDPKDRHVLAAGIQSQAQYIVTFNLKDFKPADLAIHNIQAIHPDDFALELYEKYSAEVVGMIQRHRAELTRPPKTAQQYLDTLQNIPLSKTTAALQKHINEL
jgi:predicted nucleic acid-binding protein